MTAGRILGAAQTIPRRGDVAANLEQHLRLARAAAEEHVQVLVFPELSLTGYELELAAELAFSERDPRLDPLIELASAKRLTLVVGAPVRLGERLHIGAFLLGPERSVALYTKQRLGAFPASVHPGGAVPPPEPSVFQPGDRDPLLRWNGHTGALAVCADTGLPAHAERAAARGADCYLASMFFTPGELAQESARLRSYAIRHTMAVVLANPGGPTGGLPSAGSSAIWSETGRLLVQLEPEGAGIAVAIEGQTGWRGQVVVPRGL